VIGIGVYGATISALEGDGPTERAGLRAGDRITAVGGVPVSGWLEAELRLVESPGEVSIDVERDGRTVTIGTSIPDRATLAEFVYSMDFEAGVVLTWVQEGSPAWEAGMRAGDRVVSVGGVEVSSWEDILRQRARLGKREHEIQWRRGAETMTARVTPRVDTSLSPGYLGIELGPPKEDVRRYPPLRAVREGMGNVLRTLAETVLMVRGFGSGDVSTRQMGGIILIAQASYSAASRGLGMLLYFTAVISTGLALLNILPVPVLDGGHLLFLAIEKLRGRRLSDRVMTVAQAVGFALLMLLVVYVTRNDILRVLP
jgi:regulator of sigma E protease